MPILSVENVTVRFGGVTALNEVSLAIEEGQIAGLIGPNGAGKTTVFNVITRIYSPDFGSVTFDGENLLRAAPHAIVRRGIARLVQRRGRPLAGPANLVSAQPVKSPADPRV